MHVYVLSRGEGRGRGLQVDGTQVFVVPTRLYLLRHPPPPLSGGGVLMKMCRILSLIFFVTSNSGSETLADEGRLYDAVMASEVLEHVNQPTEFLKTCERLLKVFFAIVRLLRVLSPRDSHLGC